MTEKQGFYTGATEESYRTLTQLRRGRSFTSPDPQPPDFDRMTEMYLRRQQERLELLPVPDRVEIALPSTSFIALIGDTHVGGEMVDYERLHDEVQYISDTEGAYAMFLGDVVDGFFFMPAQQDGLGNLSEEVLYAEAIFDELQGKVLAGWGGDHDLWSERTGPSMYRRFREETGAHYLHGPAVVDMRVNDTDYVLYGAHQLPGHSMYNNAHSEMRAHNFGGAGRADVVVGADKHRKGIVRQPARDVNGSYEVVYVALGPYKASDRYARKKGYGQQGYDEMGGVGLILHEDDKRIDVYSDIRQGLDDYQRL